MKAGCIVEDYAAELVLDAVRGHPVTIVEVAKAAKVSIGFRFTCTSTNLRLGRTSLKQTRYRSTWQSPAQRIRAKTSARTTF